MFLKTECITMKLGGVTDTATRKNATEVLRRQRGVRTAIVDADAVALVAYRADQTTVEALTTALAQAGYSVI